MTHIEAIKDLVYEVLLEHGIDAEIEGTTIEFDEAIDYCIRYFIYLNMGTIYSPESLTYVEDEVNTLAIAQGLIYGEEPSLAFIVLTWG